MLSTTAEPAAAACLIALYKALAGGWQAEAEQDR